MNSSRRNFAAKAGLYIVSFAFVLFARAELVNAQSEKCSRLDVKDCLHLMSLEFGAKKEVADRRCDWALVQIRAAKAPGGKEEAVFSAGQGMVEIGAKLYAHVKDAGLCELKSQDDQRTSLRILVPVNCQRSFAKIDADGFLYEYTYPAEPGKRASIKVKPKVNGEVQPAILDVVFDPASSGPGNGFVVRRPGSEDVVMSASGNYQKLRPATFLAKSLPPKLLGYRNASQAVSPNEVRRFDCHEDVRFYIGRGKGPDEWWQQDGSKMWREISSQPRSNSSSEATGTGPAANNQDK